MKTFLTTFTSRFATRRLIALGTVSGLAMASVTGCAAGKLNKNALTWADSTYLGRIIVSNAAILYPLISTGPQAKAKVIFTITNSDPAVTDRLVSITASDGASIKMSGDPTIRGGLALYSPKAPDKAAVQNPHVVDVEITDNEANLRPGLSVPLKFAFALNRADGKPNDGTVYFPIRMQADENHTFIQQQFGGPPNEAKPAGEK